MIISRFSNKFFTLQQPHVLNQPYNMNLPPYFFDIMLLVLMAIEFDENLNLGQPL